MATEITASYTRYPTTKGAVREFWLKATGLVGLSSAATATIANYIENPYYKDLVIIEAAIYVTTASGNVATDLDIGLADDAAGTNIGAELADGLVAATLNTTGVKELGIVHAIAAPPVQPIWKAKNYATDGFICTIQRGNVNASALVFNLLLCCVPLEDMTA